MLSNIFSITKCCTFEASRQDAGTPRRCVHSREFKAEEQQFPQLKEALSFIKRL